MLFVAAVPVFLLLSNVRIAATEPRVLEYSFAQYDADERTGIDRAQLDRAAIEIVRYFRNDEALLSIRGVRPSSIRSRKVLAPTIAVVPSVR